jgi:U4/U6 small nuclear ribonucleoprotein PRP3
LFKISKNAQQLKLTGILLLNPVMNLVIVEGGPKGISSYKRLMLNRINWQDRPQDAQPLSEPNSCTLVWEGQVKTRAFFHNFKTKTFELIDDAKEFLEGKGVLHYWQSARNLVQDVF